MSDSNPSSVPPPRPPRNNPLQDVEQMSTAVNQSVASTTSNIDALRTESDRARSIFGFGRRILVPADEIHVVVGHGMHSMRSSRQSEVFGRTADRPSQYWLNSLTEVIKLKTISFTVPLLGVLKDGIEALDSSKVSFRLWAHAVAKLDPQKAEIAAQRVGKDTQSLISTISEVATAELVSAAAGMSLEEIIASRQQLAIVASPKVNDILGELGYDLALLTVTRLAGNAYDKLVEQAESRIYKETTIATNVEQLAELQDVERREREEAVIRAQTLRERQNTEAETLRIHSTIEAETSKKLASARLESERSVEEATIAQTEALDIRRNEQRLQQMARKREVDASEIEQREKLNVMQHDTQLNQMARERDAQKATLTKVELDKQIGQAEAEKEALLKRRQAEYTAEIRRLEQEKKAELDLRQAEADAARLALEQVRRIERDAQFTQAEAQRLREEELEQAQRSKEIALLRAQEAGEARRLAAEAEARALQVKVQAETQTDLARAEAEAKATEQRAIAAKTRAEATRAEAAAAGLAEVEVEEARVAIAEKEVAVRRTEALAQVEVAQAEADVLTSKTKMLKTIDIEAQRELADLYAQAPVLVEMEQLRMQLSHEQEMARIQAETSLKAFEALAPGIKMHIYGHGGQVNELVSNVMSLSRGLTIVGEEVPWMGRMLGMGEQETHLTNTTAGQNLLALLNRVRPHLQEVVQEVNPRTMATLTVAEMVERLTAVVSGEEDVVTALNHLRQDVGFRVIGDLPLKPLLGLMGLNTAVDTPTFSHDDKENLVVEEMAVLS